MKDSEEEILEELERAKAALGAVEAPPPGLRSAMRASFTGAPTSDAGEAEGGAVEDVDPWLSASERASLSRTEPAPSALRDSIRDRFTGGGSATDQAGLPADPVVQKGATPTEVHAEASTEISAEISAENAAGSPRSLRWAPIALLAAAAAALLLVMTQRTETPADPVTELVDAATGNEWTLVSAPSQDQLILTPTPANAAEGELIGQLALANIVEMGSSTLTMESSEGSRIVLLQGARLAGGPFQVRECSPADPRVLALDSGQMLLNSSDRQPGGLIVATHFGDISLNGTIGVSADDVGLILAVVEGEATFQPAPYSPPSPTATEEERQEVEARNAPTRVQVDQLMVVPYPNSKAVLTGFDTELCRSSPELAQFIDLLEHFQRTGRVR